MNNILEHTRFYKNEEFSDVEFLLKDRDGNTCVIPAHRLLLMSRSIVFERMLYGVLKGGRRVEIKDVSAEAFTEYLQFFYTLKAVLTSQNIGEVLKLIEKYDTPDFYPLCDKFMEDTLSESVAYEYYVLALSFDLPLEIRVKCEQILGQNRKLIFYPCGGVNENRLIISKFLQSNELVGDEVDIFRDVMAWVKASLEQKNKAITPQNMKDELGELIEYIRFPTMTSEGIFSCLKEYPWLLSPEEYYEIISHVVHSTPMTQTTKFNTKGRLLDRVYSATFKKITSRFRNTRKAGGAELKTWEETPHKYSVALKIASNGHSRCSIQVMENLRVVDTITADLDGSWIHLTLPNIRIYNPITITTTYIDTHDHYFLDGFLSSIGLYYVREYDNYLSSLLDSNLPKTMIISANFINFISEMRLTQVE